MSANKILQRLQVGPGDSDRTLAVKSRWVKAMSGKREEKVSVNNGQLCTQVTKQKSSFS